MPSVHEDLQKCQIPVSCARKNPKNIGHAIRYAFVKNPAQWQEITKYGQIPDVPMLHYELVLAKK